MRYIFFKKDCEEDKYGQKYMKEKHDITVGDSRDELKNMKYNEYNVNDYTLPPFFFIAKIDDNEIILKHHPEDMDTSFKASNKNYVVYKNKSPEMFILFDNILKLYKSRSTILPKAQDQ